MADPKYADLPGICLDEPDFYESADLPESEQSAHTDLYPDESQSIERIHISTKDAFDKFKGKSLRGDKIDFSDRISQRLRTGYDARSGDWELAGEGNKETVMQKYQRLQCEMKELLEEVEKEKVKGKEKSDEDVCLVSGKQVQESLRKLSDLRLEDALGNNVVSSITDPEGTEIKKLFSQLEKFKQGMADLPESQASSDETGITFQLNYRPEQAKLVQTARVAELEKRLHRLENVLGSSSDKLSRLTSSTSKGSLLETAEHLSATVTLLNSSQLDHIEGRLTALSQKLDSITEKKSQLAKDDEKDHMIMELYELVKHSESITQLLPQTIDRLKALEGLHMKAADFARTLTQVETLQTEIVTNAQNNKALLQGVQESFVRNLDEMNKNVLALDNRIKALKKSSK